MIILHPASDSMKISRVAVRRGQVSSCMKQERRHKMKINKSGSGREIVVFVPSKCMSLIDSVNKSHVLSLCIPSVNHNFHAASEQPKFFMRRNLPKYRDSDVMIRERESQCLEPIFGPH